MQRAADAPSPIRALPAADGAPRSDKKVIPADASSSSNPMDKVALALRQGLSKQHQQALEQYGESITIMVVGETGVGKTSLLANLLHQQLEWPSGERTLGVRVKVVKLSLGGDEEKGVPFEARLVDSPGWGDTLSLRRNFRLVTNYIDGTHMQQLRCESAVRRTVRPAHAASQQHVDVVLYVFSPHRCKGVDMAFLSKLHRRVAIVPVLAKADTMTTTELAIFRDEVTSALRAARIEVAHPPVAVIFADPQRLDSGRVYPWGVAKSEDPKSTHSELPLLRSFLLTDGLLQLKQQSQLHYENFRSRALRRKSLVDTSKLSAATGLAALLLIGSEGRKRVLERLAAALPLSSLWLPVLSISWRRVCDRPSPLPEPSSPPPPSRFRWAK